MDEGVGRQYFDFSVRATGPVFNRIFNPPEGKEGTKYKHVIQPSVTLQKVTNIDVFDQIVKLESGDYAIGRTQVTYDLTNRLYAKKDVAREILSLSVNQSYYTDARAAQYDLQYQSSFTAKQAVELLAGRAAVPRVADRSAAGGLPDRVGPDRARAAQHRANAKFSSGDWLNGSAGWSQRRFIPELPGFDDPNLPTSTSTRRSTSAARATGSAATTRSTTTSSTTASSISAGSRIQLRSAAASVSSIRPSTCRARSCRRT